MGLWIFHSHLPFPSYICCQLNSLICFTPAGTQVFQESWKKFGCYKNIIWVSSQYLVAHYQVLSDSVVIPSFVEWLKAKKDGSLFNGRKFFFFLSYTVEQQGFSKRELYEVFRTCPKRIYSALQCNWNENVAVPLQYHIYCLFSIFLLAPIQSSCWFVLNIPSQDLHRGFPSCFVSQGLLKMSGSINFIQGS